PTDGCTQSVLSNSLENGGFFGGTSNQRLAVDIIVEEGISFTIDTVKPTVVDYATNFTFIFYEDETGVPGAEIANVTGTIESETVTGNNFGYDFVQYTVSLDTPVVLEGSSTSKYWMEIQSDALAWESTTVQSQGDFGAFSNDESGGWLVGTSDYVYEISGECNELGLGDLSSFDFSYYPNPVQDELNITSKKEVESVSVYNLVGQQVLSSSKVANGQLNLSMLPTGTYVFKVVLEGGQVETFKIIKK
ncbi:MAG: T9SS type A sorting domain-containing protein, partial [Moheibacter sp.]